MKNSSNNLDLAGIRAALSKRAHELREEIRAKLMEIQGEHIGFDSPNATDGGDAARLDESEALHIAEAGRDAAELEEIDSALHRIESGTYGFCVDCGLNIGTQRLTVNPSASRCASCQKISEAK